MSKNKLYIHITIFLILLSVTGWFTYKSFLPELNNETNQEKQDFEEEKSEIQQNKIKKIEQTKTIENTEKKVQDINLINIEETIKIEEDQEKIIEALPYSAIITVADKSYNIGFAQEEIILKNLMDKLQNESDFTFSGIDYSGIGFFVNEINGIKNSNQENKYWVYYLNGKSAQAGISIQKINSGDNIEWKYENSTF
jgi:uncharacterized transporter YbjL